MRNARRLVGALALLVTLILVAACSSDAGDDGERDDSSDIDGSAITVGSANFNESRILAEIYAQAFEAADFEVNREFGIGAREDYMPLLLDGKVDFVPEYLAALLLYLDGKPTNDTEATRALLVTTLADKGIVVLASAPAQDRDGQVVTTETAKAHGLTKVSDLVPVAAQLRIGGPPECPERHTCLAGLREVYGLEFAEFVPLDVGGPQTATALEEGEIDVAVLFTTDGRIAANDLVLLEDDGGLQAAENITPLVRGETLEEHGSELSAVADAVSQALTTHGLTELNREVSIERQNPADVARRWLENAGLV